MLLPNTVASASGPYGPGVNRYQLAGCPSVPASARRSPGVLRGSGLHRRAAPPPRLAGCCSSPGRKGPFRRCASWACPHNRPPQDPCPRGGCAGGRGRTRSNPLPPRASRGARARPGTRQRPRRSPALPCRECGCRRRCRGRGVRPRSGVRRRPWRRGPAVMAAMLRAEWHMLEIQCPNEISGHFAAPGGCT